MKWKLPKTTQRGSFLGRQIIKKKKKKERLQSNVANYIYCIKRVDSIYINILK
jgi:hypothetical protein